MASSLDSDLSPDLRVAIALTINRQDLVNQQVSWAVPGIAPGNSHVYVQGQPDYKPPPPASSTTTVPAATSSTSTTVDRRRRQRELPGDAGARRRRPRSSRRRDSSARRAIPYYHSAFGVPFQLHMVYDSSDPWAAAAAPAIRVPSCRRPGFDTTLRPVAGAAETGQVLADGLRRPGRAARSASRPYMSQTMAWYTQLLGPAGQERVAGLDGLLEQPVRPAGDDGLAAAQPEHGGRLLHAGGHAAVGRDGLAAALRRADGPGLEPDHRGRRRRRRASTSLLWYAQLWAVRVPRVDQQHDAVAAGPVGAPGSGGRIAGSDGRVRRGPMPRATISGRCCSSGIARRSGGIGRRASLRGWCPQGRGGSSPPSDTIVMSRDIVDSCRETSWTISGSRGLVDPLRVQSQVADQVAGGSHDAHVTVLDQQQDRLAVVPPSHPEVAGACSRSAVSRCPR